MLSSGNAPEFIYTDYQTAGRGQRGNGWESEAGKNLLCSILIERRQVLACTQGNSLQPFYLNVAVSVAVHRTICSLLQSEEGSNSEAVSIKWPNDIYWRDKKLAGILIENAIIGSEWGYSIAGIGLNVNQTEWKSDAPNPLSLKQITGKDYHVDTLMVQLLEAVHQALKEDVRDYYIAHLYRSKGFWPFVEREVNLTPTMNAGKDEPENAGHKPFLAQIKQILPTGEIVLQDKNGQLRQYHFKQIRYVIES